MRSRDIKYWLKHLALDAAAAARGDRAAGHAAWTRLREHPLSRYGRPFPAPPRPHAPLHVAMMLTPCCWYPFTSPLVQLALALRAHGIGTDFIAGHGGECGFFGSNADWSAARCTQTFQWLDREILPDDARLLLLNDYVTDAARAQAEQYLLAHAATPLCALQASGIELWDVIQCTLARQAAQVGEAAAGVGDPNAPLGEQPAAQRWVRGSLINIAAIEAWLQAWRAAVPEGTERALMLFSGFTYQERLAAHLARRQGVRVIAHENSSFANRRIFDATGQIGNATSVAHDTWPRVRDRRLTPAQEARLDRHFGAIFAGVNNTIAQRGGETADALAARLGLDPTRPIVLMLAQVPHDAVMVRDLIFYADSVALIRAVIDASAALTGCQLVIRLHPGEGASGATATGNALRAAGLPAHVRLVEGHEANTHALMRLATAAVTATSQAGLEFLWLGKPLVVAGAAFYGGKGFTLRGTSTQEMEEAMARAVQQRTLSDDERARCRSFLYHVAFEHQVPYDARHLRFPPRSVDRIAALLRGEDFIDWDDAPGR